MQAERAGLAGDEAGGNEHVGVGGVGAAGDGRDHHVTMAGCRNCGLRRGSAGRCWRAARSGWPLRSARKARLASVSATRSCGRLGPARAGDDCGHVELDGVGEDGVGRGGVAEHALGAEIGFDQRDAVLVAAGQVQVGERFGVHREEAAGGAVFWCHVGDGGAVGDCQVVQSGAEEFDELADDALLAENLGDRQHEVGGRSPFGHLAGEAEADHVRDQHGDRLAEHGGFGLDAAHAPAEHAGAVDHGRVAVRAIERVRIGDGGAVHLGGPHHLAHVFQIYLVADAGAWRDDAEVLEGFLAPAQKGVAFAVALELDGDVLLQRLRGAAEIDHDGVVDDEINRDERVDLLRIAVEAGDAVTHGGEIDHGGHAGEILHEDAGGLEGHFVRAAAGLQPGRDLVGVRRGVAVAPSSKRRMFSSRTFRLTGRRLTSPMVLAASGMEK